MVCHSCSPIQDPEQRYVTKGTEYIAALSEADHYGEDGLSQMFSDSRLGATLRHRKIEQSATLEAKMITREKGGLSQVSPIPLTDNYGVTAPTHSR